MSATTAKPADRKALPTNEQLATALEEVAELLEEQGANEFRVRAYRGAAETLRKIKGTAHRILKVEGVAGLVRLPGIGRSLGHAIEQMIRTNHMPLLERLRGEHVAERVFATVPDIGPKMAQRIHEQLNIETLAELEAAANDGRLAEVPGMGRKRIRAVREAWLPIWHPVKGGRHYTILYFNTARAHELGTTHDWVVIYRDDDSDHGRWTVITANYGRLRGRRIVRGREDECTDYYVNQSSE